MSVVVIGMFFVKYMSKTFTCCELVKRVKELINESQQDDKSKYQALEFLHKSALKIT